MKLRTLGMVLIGFGVVFLLYALNMPVAMPESDVVNFRLISERQNMLLIGGLVFMSGIILFAVAKLKQTESEDAFERSHQIEKKEKAKQLLNNATDRGISLTFTKLPDLWRRNFVGLSQGWLSIIVRIVAAIAAQEFVNNELYSFGTNVLGMDLDTALYIQRWVPWLLVIYAFRRIPLFSVLKHILIACLSLTIGYCVNLIMHGGLPNGILLYVLIGQLVGLICLFVADGAYKKKGASIQST